MLAQLTGCRRPAKLSAIGLDADPVARRFEDVAYSQDISRWSGPRRGRVRTGSGPVPLRHRGTGGHRRAQVRRRSCGASLSMAALLAQSFTTCHTARSVTPSPQVLPARQTHRSTRPSLNPADASHESMALLTQSGTGTVRTCRALPTKSTIAQ